MLANFNAIIGVFIGATIAMCACTGQIPNRITLFCGGMLLALKTAREYCQTEVCNKRPCVDDKPGPDGMYHPYIP